MRHRRGGVILDGYQSEFCRTLAYAGEARIILHRQASGVSAEVKRKGAVAVGVFPGVFDGGAGLADAAHAVDGALAFDDDGTFGGEVLAEFGEELIAAFEQGAEGGVWEVGGLPGEDGDFKFDGLDGLADSGWPKEAKYAKETEGKGRQL